ncbi:MAG: dinitrogenase iron-molybdenum cofactor biosynthesis protein [Desulfuromonas sp.]|nr:MAG: dinitrogenase iron-molybdenum cofactor biosynthesis protein [Desulfuromonas sp.]
MLIAVSSKSGTEVDQHFGHAEKFTIYKYSSVGSEVVKEVDVEKYCSFDPDHPFRHRQFNAIAEALDGCRAVATVMIGDLPKQELEKLGIKAVTVSGPIEEALKATHDAVCEGGCGGRKNCQHQQ